MSLNRFEQRIFDYWQGHGDERQFWLEKVQSISKRLGDDHASAVYIEKELWRYYVERSAAVASFKEAARHEGLQRTSLKNLAEFLIRSWVEPRSKKKRDDSAETQSGRLP